MDRSLSSAFGTEPCRGLWSRIARARPRPPRPLRPLEVRLRRTLDSPRIARLRSPRDRGAARGRPVVGTVDSSPKDDIGAATGLADVGATSESILAYVRYFASLPPISLSARDCINMGIAGKSLRHVVPTCLCMFNIKKSTAGAGEFAVGTWALLAVQHPGTRECMPERYAGSEPPLFAGALARIRVVTQMRA